MRALLELRDTTLASPAQLEAGARGLGHEHPVVRRAALDALAHQSEHAGATLPADVARRASVLVGDPDPQVRAEACASLALIAPIDDEDRDRRVQSLLTALRDPEAGVRQEAAAALGDLPLLGASIDVARDPLAALLEDANLGVRFEAAFALARIGDSRARTVLEGALRNGGQRMDAMEGLRRLGDPEAIPALRRQVERWLLPWSDRLTGLATLIALGERQLEPELMKSLRSRRAEVRIHAAVWCGRLGIAAARPTLEALASAKDELAADAAADALAQLASTAELASKMRAEVD